VPVRQLVRAVLDTPDAGWSPDDGDKDEISEFVTGTQFTCFTSTKVQILTPEELRADLLVKQKGEMLHVYFGMRFDVASETLEVLSLRALLVQKYKY